jgi:hypothetical protein
MAYIREVEWAEFLLKFPTTNEECVSCTGLDLETMKRVFVKYGRKRSPISTPQAMFETFWYLKMYPTGRQVRLSIRRTRTAKRLFDDLQRRVLHLASVIDELQAGWDERFGDHNKLPHVFGNEVTGCLDSFPIYVDRPSDSRLQRLLYNHKYGGHVLKVQVVVDHQGTPIWFSGPHLGVISDPRLANSVKPPLSPFEVLLADKAYYCKHPGYLRTPFKKRPNLQLPIEAVAFNLWHRWYRATVEQTIGYIKRFKILSSQYRGHIFSSNTTKGIDVISAAVKVIIHVSAMYTRAHPRRVPLPIDGAPGVVDFNNLRKIVATKFGLQGKARKAAKGAASVPKLARQSGSRKVSSKPVKAPSPLCSTDEETEDMADHDIPSDSSDEEISGLDSDSAPVSKGFFGHAVRAPGKRQVQFNKRLDSFA